MIGIIPAAGQATRFGGILKELLPYNGESLLQRTVRILRRTCSTVVVVSTPEKIAEHARNVNAYFVKQQGHGLLAALKSIGLNDSYYLFAMPDTLFPEDAFPQYIEPDSFLVGLFKTTEGQKYGVWRDGQIVDKNPDIRGVECHAWGLLGWPLLVQNQLRETYLRDHTDFFNLALEMTPVQTFMLDYYYDLGDFESYRTCLNLTSSATASKS